MAYSVDIIYSKNQDLSNPQTETESGKPASVTLENLDSNSTYYTKAVLMVDGTAEAESTVSNFTTLQAGTITLSNPSVVRNGANWVVSYDYFSTYAPSSAVLSADNRVFQGWIDSSLHTVSFTLNGLSGATTYQTSTTMTDLYGETGTASWSFATDWSGQYFTVVNEWRDSITVTVENSNSNARTEAVQTSTDNGVTWTTYNIYKGSTTNVGTIQPGNGLMMRHSGDMRYLEINATNNFSVCGNIASLYENTIPSGRTAMPDYAFESLFWTDKLTSAENLYFGSYGSTGIESCTGMFHYCSNLTKSPDLSSITTVGNYGLQNMFYGCTSLTAVPDLSHITSVGNYGLGRMFMGCSALAGTVGLSGVTAVGISGMSEMFANCTSLTGASGLGSVTTAGNMAFQSMFYGCTSLASSPSIPNLASAGQSCFNSMFTNCTSLTSVPDLSGLTSAGDYCMNNMFNGCTSITSGPDISGITTAGNSCFAQMFYGCTNLVTGADITGVTTLGTDGVRYMYYNCGRLTTAYAPTITWDTTKAYLWLGNVASSGELYANPSIIASIPNNNTSGCPNNWYKHGIGQPEYMCFTDVSGSSNTLTLTKTNTGNVAPTVSLQYSTDTANWTTWTETNSVRTYSIPANGTVYLRGVNENGLGYNGSGCHTFSATGNVNALGNIMTIADGTGIRTDISRPFFARLFYGMTKLKTAPDFPNDGMSTGDSTLSRMFEGCTGLVKAPSITITSMSSGYGCSLMFSECTSLTDASNVHLNATTIGGNEFTKMFYGCTALTHAPHCLPATTIGQSAYKDMFNGCTSLVTMPIIKATEFPSAACQTMFDGCTSLTNQWASEDVSSSATSGIAFTATSVAADALMGMFQNTAITDASGIKLNATTVYARSFKSMFYNCTSLEIAPEIMATTLTYTSGVAYSGSLSDMFYNCSSLSSIKVHFTDWGGGNSTQRWTYGTKSTGTFYKPSSLPATKNSSGNTSYAHYIPYNWTVTNI